MLLSFCPKDPFKCGVIKSSKTRSIFIYQPQGNTTTNTTTANTPFTITNTTSHTNQVKDTDHQIDVNQKLLDELYADVLEPVQEEIVIPEVRVDTRIVNGEECPPGQCPWQVEGLVCIQWCAI